MNLPNRPLLTCHRQLEQAVPRKGPPLEPGSAAARPTARACRTAGRQAAAAAAFESALSDGITVAGPIARDLPMYREVAVRHNWLNGYRKAEIEV